jgi:hypothetical protein
MSALKGVQKSALINSRSLRKFNIRRAFATHIARLKEARRSGSATMQCNLRFADLTSSKDHAINLKSNIAVFCTPFNMHM